MAQTRSAAGNAGRSRPKVSATKGKTSATRLKGTVAGRPNFISQPPASRKTRPAASKAKATPKRGVSASGNTPKRARKTGPAVKGNATLRVPPLPPALVKAREQGIGTASRGKPGSGRNAVVDAIGNSNPIDKLYMEIGNALERALGK